jgi:hypothetical protein
MVRLPVMLMMSPVWVLEVDMVVSPVQVRSAAEDGIGTRPGMQSMLRARIAAAILFVDTYMSLTSFPPDIVKDLPGI